MLKLFFILIISAKAFALELEPYMTTSRLLYIPKQNCYSQEPKKLTCYLYENELEDICGYKPPWRNYTLMFEYSIPYDEIEDWIPYDKENLKNIICGVLMLFEFV